MYDAATRRSAGGRRGSSRGTYIVHCTREAPQAEPDRAFARQATLGNTRALACPLRRLAAMCCRGKVRDGEGAIASTRGACAPRKRPLSLVVSTAARAISHYYRSLDLFSESPTYSRASSSLSRFSNRAIVRLIG